MFHDILVYVDGSPQSQTALSQAIALADADHARLTILATIPRPPCWAMTPMTAPGIEPLAKELADEARATLCAAVRRVPSDLPVTSILTGDSTRRALHAAVRRGHHDLVVMGAGHGRWSGHWRERTCRLTLRRCAVRVLVVGDEIGLGAPWPIAGPGPIPASLSVTGSGSTSVAGAAVV